MTDIDILAYELKYKNDAMVIDLLSAYRDAEVSLSVHEYTQDDQDRANQEGIAMGRRDVEDYADDIDSLLDDLSEGTDKEKKLALQGLEKLVERMRA